MKKDDYAFFLEPVNLEKVPGYMDVIKKPMDFGTMADKVSRSKYRSLDEFADDFRLVISNAKTFNPPPNVLKHGHLTTFLRPLPMSSSMRRTGTLRLNAMKMSSWMPTRTWRQVCPLGPTHLDVVRPL